MIEVGEWVLRDPRKEVVARGPLLADSKDAALMGAYSYGANAEGETPTVMGTGWSVTATVEGSIS